MPNMFEPSRAKPIFSTDVNNCSYSSGTSSLETLLDTSHMTHKGSAKALTVKDAKAPCTTKFLNEDCSDGDEFFDDVLEEGKATVPFFFCFWMHYIWFPSFLGWKNGLHF